jgi:hypothetical protein
MEAVHSKRSGVMWYAHATEDTVAKCTLPQGTLLLVFPPEEQALAYDVICGIMKAVGYDEELTQTAQMLRCSFEKGEVN